MNTLLIATTNQGKIQEIKKLLETHLSSIKVLSLDDFPAIEEADEPFQTFLENAIHKARYYAQAFQTPTISDDSGLCIDALKGWPGIGTKEFIVSCQTRDEVFNQLDFMLQGVESPQAYFHCSVCFYDPTDGTSLHSSCDHHGHLTFPAQGAHGFGFDPIFIPQGYEHTMAELGDEIKSEISHRAQALRSLFRQVETHWRKGRN